MLIAFDILAYLEQSGIPHRTEGKNISAGWIGVQCPFCRDKSAHLGINLRSKLFSCWICGAKGSAQKLICEWEGLDWDQAFAKIMRFQTGIADPISEKRAPICALPPGALDKFPDLHREYLAQRGFSAYHIERYGLRAYGNSGTWKYRVLIPVRHKRAMVSFTARDVTGRSPLRYKQCPREYSPLTPKETLFALDDATGNSVAVVEGPFDAMKLGDNVVATFGVTYTAAQISLLANLPAKRIFAIFDPGAETQAHNLCQILSSLGKQTEQIEIGEKDPAELSASDAKYLRRELGL